MLQTPVCRYAARGGAPATGAFLLLSLLLTTALLAAENPFEQVAEQSYAGRFVGPDVAFRLKPDAGKWSGTVVLKGRNFTLQGEQKDGKLVGTYSDGDQSWPFSATSDGDNLTFTAGTFTAKLQRQKLPKLEGVYASKRVKLNFQNKDGGLNGTILFNGKQFQFTAKESSGDLEGVFKSADEAFKFTLQVGKDELQFRTGTFEEVISLAERHALERAKLLRASIPGLKKELTALEGTFWRNLCILTNGLTIGGSLGSDYESLAFSSGIEESQGERTLWATMYFVLPAWKKKDPATRSMAGIRLNNISKLWEFSDYGSVIKPTGGKLGGIVIKLKSAVSVNYKGSISGPSASDEVTVAYASTEGTGRAEKGVYASFEAFKKTSEELNASERELGNITQTLREQAEQHE